MILRIEMYLDNDAFRDENDEDTGGEVRRILTDLVSRLSVPYCCTPSPLNLYDVNGDRVGTAEIADLGAKGSDDGNRRKHQGVRGR